MAETYPHQTLFNLPFFNGRLTDATDFIWKKILDNQFVAVATPNPEQVVQMGSDANFREALKSFDVFLPDGQGIIWASKRLKKPLTQRVTGVDVTRYLVEKMDKAGPRGLVIGGQGYDEVEEVSNTEKIRKIDVKAVQIYKQKEEKISEHQLPEMLKKYARPGDIQERFAQLHIPSVTHYSSSQSTSQLYWLRDFRKESYPDTQLALEWIQQNHPIAVFVALGAPYQELWIAKHRETLKKAGVRCVMTVGGAFDILTGRINRAPLAFQNLGMEWLYRLFQQPWRWKRQLRLVEFVLLALFK